MLGKSNEQLLNLRLGSQPKFEGNVTSLSPGAPAVRIVRTGPRGVVNSTSEFSTLLNTVRDAGLLHRRRRFYIITFVALSIAMGGAWVGFSFLHDSWYQLFVAAALGIIFTQFAFLAHEASHRQVWASGRANDHTGRFIADLLVGISYSWWMNKHSRHHANPNTQTKDPDIEPDFILFQEDDAAALRGSKGLRGFYAKLVERQGWLLFPAMTLEGINLHRHAFLTVLRPGKVDKRALEIVLLAVRNIGYLAVLFTLLPPGIAAAFLGVQLAVFGLYMGASFAPNHTGMPILPAKAKVDFLSRQVLTSRNIRGGFGMDIFMGGLNYQIEHHLFPSMARPHLKRASEIVREYCEARNIHYTATSLPHAYGTVIQYLNKVGLSARDSFECPKATGFGVYL
jgi:fatty acid desaturase